MSEQAIVLNELTKHYGKHRGINNLSFSVNQGEFFGFIGPNGAGKSTTIRTLMGLIRPTGGSASIFDLDCHSWNIRIPVHKACGAENHCSGEGDRFSSEPAGVRPVQRRVQLFHDRSSFGRSGSAGSGAFHNDGNVLYPASLFCLGSAVCQPFQIL